jgi:excisionase family DNA binding protein
MMTPEQIADAMGVSRSTISRKIKAGELRAVKVGNRNRIPVEEFERFWHQTMGDMVELVRDDIETDIFGDAR